MTTIADRIKKAREAQGLTQTELAVRCGYSDKTSISKIENSGNNITLKKIEKISDALGVSHTYLMGWEDENGELTLLGRVGTSYINGDFLSTVTEDEINILAKLRSIPEKDKTRVLDLLDSFYKEYLYEKKETSLA